MRVLIVEDGTQRGALAAVRSLGRAGHEVAVAAPERGHAARSRHCKEWHAIPAPVPPTSSFASAIGELCASGTYDVAFGVGDAEAIALSRHRDEIPVSLGYPAHEVVERSFDKAHVAELAQSVGIQVPRTLDRDAVTFPVIVKERIHAPDTAETDAMRIPVVKADDEAELAAAVRAVEQRGGEVLLEEFAGGSLEAFIVFAHEGRVLARVQQVAGAVFPPGAGVSVRAETIAIDEGLATKIAALVAEMAWTGVAEVQFVRAPGSEPKLIDFNGRFYGSLALAIAAGVDLPVMWLGAATGGPPSGVVDARAGVRYQWLEGDLRRARAEGEGLLGCLAYGVGATHSIWSAADPAPALRFASELARRGIKKAVTWRSRKSSTR